MNRRVERLAGDIARFVRQYGRRGKAYGDPNDRPYDRKLEQRIRHMRPEELNELVLGPDDLPQPGADETEDRNSG